MIEILLIFNFSKKIAAMMKEKGRAPAGYVVLFVFMWIGGEVLGALIGGILAGTMDPAGLDGNNFTCGAYIFALVGAAIGGTVAYQIAKSAEPIHHRPIPDFDEHDDDDYGRGIGERRRRRRTGSHDEAIEED